VGQRQLDGGSNEKTLGFTETRRDFRSHRGMGDRLRLIQEKEERDYGGGHD
jgi:hypothetical protein